MPDERKNIINIFYKKEQHGIVKQVNNSSLFKYTYSFV